MAQKKQVKPHPCDRDYQHAEGLLGCAPDQAAIRSRGPMGLVHLDAKIRWFPEPNDDFGHTGPDHAPGLVHEHAGQATL
jgi:hypothetical protein